MGNNFHSTKIKRAFILNLVPSRRHCFQFSDVSHFFSDILSGNISVALPHQMVEFWDIRLVGYSLELLNNISKDKVMAIKRQVTECKREIGW